MTVLSLDVIRVFKDRSILGTFISVSFIIIVFSPNTVELIYSGAKISFRRALPITLKSLSR